MKLFLDTNVLIDFMSERLPHYIEAAAILSFAVDHRCDVAVSSLSMVTSNFICCERGKMPLADWKRKANLIKNFVEVCSIEPHDIFFACDSDWDDFEDNVQYIIAKRSGCNVIVSRNVRDFVTSDIPVMTPNGILEFLERKSDKA